MVVYLEIRIKSMRDINGFLIDVSVAVKCGCVEDGETECLCTPPPIQLFLLRH